MIVDDNSAERFRLTKWYFDCTDRNGRIAIGYQATLTWRALAVGWQEVTLYDNSGPPYHQSQAGATSPVEIRNGQIRWAVPRLGSAFEIVPVQPAVGERLLSTDHGAIDWRSEAPAARVSVQVDAAAMTGVGYVERLSMSMPPWRTGIHELRWGRWMTDDGSRSVVWIDWRGVQNRTWVFVDGMPLSPATVTDESVTAGSIALALGAPRTLVDRGLGRVASTIPGLTSLLPRAVLDVRDVKLTSPALLSLASGISAGTAIHECVIFP